MILVTYNSGDVPKVTPNSMEVGHRGVLIDKDPTLPRSHTPRGRGVYKDIPPVKGKTRLCKKPTKSDSEREGESVTT